MKSELYDNSQKSFEMARDIFKDFSIDLDLTKNIQEAKVMLFGRPLPQRVSLQKKQLILEHFVAVCS